MEPIEYKGFIISPMYVWHGGEEKVLRYFVDGVQFNPDGYPTLGGAKAAITKKGSPMPRG